MEKILDVIVVGAGPSGMMAAIAAASNGSKVALFDKNKRLGKKLLMTGGGRCNVTNNRPVEDFIQHIPGNGRFLYSTFSQWNNEDIMSFFADRGIGLKEEDHGRIFPTTDKSKTIVDALRNELEQLGVTIIYQSAVEKIIHDQKKVTGVRTLEGDYLSKSIVLATGGLTYPSTGATGDGYRLAKQVGHHVTPLYPTESPVLIDEDFIQKKDLQGLSLRDIRLSVLNEKGKPVTNHKMDVLFTHFGLSGPAALRCSSFINQLLKQQERVTLTLDCFPNTSKEELIRQLEDQLQNSTKQVKNALNGFLPERLLKYFLEKLDIDALGANQMKKTKVEALAELCKNWKLSAKGTFGLEKSFVTGGGVDLKEISPKTMESKKITGLFIAGELLDINGYTGGFNITSAFCTGYVAGTHAAYHSFA
ncbi:NAD(P)/FAD-dependent oxidoreductase [Candidatus Enterococcus ferrettii]|uniref:Flavoprotein n=1 Tax=Candidatus Enterococcus ferrettii TaxID=2815324 RepID=A0ABV0ETT9_9ENTE|nr:NAD(P)/FAD-dependent oxidoreductase [Enterococcus sp. 665A]MBO1342690.1 NAD(P)/FAD-dependent oxidoreductase [Enterococcus sp. 665A]